VLFSFTALLKSETTKKSIKRHKLAAINIIKGAIFMAFYRPFFKALKTISQALLKYNWTILHTVPTFLYY